MKLSLWWLVLLMGQCWAGSARQSMSIEQMAAQADLVLRGRVIGKTCQRDGVGRIYTRVDLELSDVWKGAVTKKVFPVVFGGGILGTERHAIAGQVEFAIDEEVAVFAVFNQRGEGVVLALGQGKFTVASVPGTDRKMVSNRFYPASTGAALDVHEMKMRVQGVNP